MSAGEFLQELFYLRSRWVHCSTQTAFCVVFCVYLSCFVRQANLCTNTHTDEDISSHSWQVWAVSLLCYCSHYRLQMQMTAALSLRFNLHLLWRDSDTYPSAKYLQWEASRGTSSAHSQSHAPSVSVSHNLCLSFTQALSLHYWWPMGLETRRVLGPARRSCSVQYIHTYIDIAISLHTLVCSTKSCWPWEGCMFVRVTQNDALGNLETGFVTSCTFYCFSLCHFLHRISSTVMTASDCFCCVIF